MPNTPLLLYSAGTWLAFSIAERFYGGVHYVWCSPFYDAATAARHYNIPPSSSPAEIYRTLEEDTRRGDRHSQAVGRNRDGVARGANAKRAAGVLNESQHAEVLYLIEHAEAREFRPVLYVMPFDRVSAIAVAVAARERANPFSVEYRIEELPNRCFDLLELRR